MTLSCVQLSCKEEIEDWPWLDQAVLRSSRSRQVCMTCHFVKAYTTQLALEPGDAFEIKLGRKQIKLIPLGAAEEE